MSTTSRSEKDDENVSQTESSTSVRSIKPSFGEDKGDSSKLKSTLSVPMRIAKSCHTLNRFVASISSIVCTGSVRRHRENLIKLFFPAFDIFDLLCILLFSPTVLSTISKMVAIRNLLLLGSVGTALILSKRDFGTVVGDITNIHSRVKSLSSTLEIWTSSNGLGILGAAPILTAEQGLDSAINNAATHASQTSQLTDEQSESLAASVDALKTNTSMLLTAMKNKKTDFASVGALGIVRSSITSLTATQDKYSNALVRYVSPRIAINQVGKHGICFRDHPS